MSKYNNIQIDDVGELRQRIDTANCVNEINDLRYACVYHMNNGHPEILKIWQDKYLALKTCPTCGRQIN